MRLSILCGYSRCMDRLYYCRVDAVVSPRVCRVVFLRFGLFFCLPHHFACVFFFFFQAEDGIRDVAVTGVQTCALPILVLFNISAIVGLRWLTTAASQFGLASLGLWLLAMVVFFLPSAIAVRELADIDPGAGGIYRWVRRAFGPTHGFVAGWGYWVNNLFYFPSLLVSTAAIAAYAAGPRFVRLGDDNVFIAVVSLVGLWLAVGLNVVGLRVGKRLQNLGGHGTWLPGLLLLVFRTVALPTA